MKSVRLPLPTLLSQALVAFTIEFDNEFENQVPHRISRTKLSPVVRGAPWLVSLVMWSNFMRFVGEGISVRELQTSAGLDTKGTRSWVDRMGRWWGYMVVDSQAMVRPTPGGRKAQEVWPTLFGLIDNRWQERFGKAEIARLRGALWALVSRLDRNLPEYLPIVKYGLFAPDLVLPGAPLADPEQHLPALLSKVLHTFALEYESESPVSLALSANILRLLTEDGVRVAELPRLSGVFKEVIRTAVGLLEKRRWVILEPDPTAGRARLARLTPLGLHAQLAYQERLRILEEAWRTRFGEKEIRNLRESLEVLGGTLFEGLQPYPNGWRASVPAPETLPHHPMVLHRGGFPDGA